MLTDKEIAHELMKNHSRLWAMAHSITHDFHLTEDTLQEVSIVLIKKKEKFDESRSFLKWALGITRIEALRTLNRHNKNNLMLDEGAYDKLEQLIAEDKRTYSEDRVEALKGCLKELSPENHKILQMKYLHKYSARRISNLVDRTETATHSLLQRLRMKMVNCINGKLEREA